MGGTETQRVLLLCERHRKPHHFLRHRCKRIIPKAIPFCKSVVSTSHWHMPTHLDQWLLSVTHARLRALEKSVTHSDAPIRGWWLRKNARADVYSLGEDGTVFEKKKKCADIVGTRQRQGVREHKKWVSFMGVRFRGNFACTRQRNMKASRRPRCVVQLWPSPVACSEGKDCVVRAQGPIGTTSKSGDRDERKDIDLFCY